MIILLQVGQRLCMHLERRKAPSELQPCACLPACWAPITLSQCIPADENKPLGRGLGVKGLPCLLIFDGARGCVEQLEVTASRLGQLT